MQLMVVVDVLLDVRPFSVYTFTVVVCTAVGCTTSASTSVTTLQDTPAGLRRSCNEYSRTSMTVLCHLSPNFYVLMIYTRLTDWSLAH